jgi:molybdate transport system ATP-binding protein
MNLKARFKITQGSFHLNVDLNIPDRGVTALFGPSGSGKTTLLRAIAGLDYHRDATLSLGTRVWQNAQHFVPTHQRPLGYVFQEPSLFTHLSVMHNLEYGLLRVPKSERKVSLRAAIELLKIEHLLDRKPTHLSGGEAQRVAIARAVAVSPKLLLMDEPLAALELNRRTEILPYLESLCKDLDIPVIYVSHSTDEVARLADHLILLENGKTTASGPIWEMLTRLDLSLAHRKDAEALIEAQVVEHDKNYHLTHLDSCAGRFTVVHENLEMGARVKLRIAARDVSLVLEPPLNTSILNIFPAVVKELKPEGKAQIMVRLLVGSVPMLARITRKSASLLNLTLEKQVYAQAKSIALLS